MNPSPDTAPVVGDPRTTGRHPGFSHTKATVERQG
jgi:hypothetical protein